MPLLKPLGQSEWRIEPGRSGMYPEDELDWATDGTGACPAGCSLTAASCVPALTQTAVKVQGDVTLSGLLAQPHP